jgi:hypothetical protein
LLEALDCGLRRTSAASGGPILAAKCAATRAQAVFEEGSWMRVAAIATEAVDDVAPDLSGKDAAAGEVGAVV